MKKQTCKNCKYFEKVENFRDRKGFGYCKRLPPSITFSGNLGVYYPHNSENDYCGEYKPNIKQNYD